MDARHYHPLATGDAAPPCIAFKADGKLFASEAQAGRPLALLAVATLDDPRVRALIGALDAALPVLHAHGCDALALTREDPFAAFRFQQAHQPNLTVAGQGESFIRACGLEAAVPCLLAIDRNWRIVATHPFGDTPAEALAAAVCADLAALPREAPQRLDMPAPVLILPNLIDKGMVAELIGLHGSGGSFESGVTSIDAAGRSYMKLDPTRKSRRDHWIAEETPLHARLHDVFAKRLFPEINKVFQAEMSFADRLLVACYPEQQGLFTRHRDNSSPTVAFRKFAMSLNLNVGDYEGGDLIFPEYSPHLYSPPTGGAAVFSASLLHEVTRVTRGNRYVLLTFFHDAAGEAMRLAS
jgi:hypothetical protein